MKKTILGNFLTQANKDFPLDCELLNNLQNSQFLVSVLGNMAGNKAILFGCELSGSRRGEGYVFLRTEAHREGEVLYFEGGNVSAGMYLKQETESISAQGYEYPQAYTVRTLAAGVGEENYDWSDFKSIKSLPELEKEIADKEKQIAALAQSPLGLVQIWAGSGIPQNYALCDGSALKRSEYPELFAVLGETYNTAVNYNGVPYTTPSDSFRLPDLRERFIVGLSDSQGDHDTKGKAGGAKIVALSASQMPSHVHSVDDYYYIESIASAGTGLSGFTDVPNTRGSGRTDSDNTRLLYKTHDSASAGGGNAHENRPPYYTLAYIIRLK